MYILITKCTCSIHYTYFTILVIYYLYCYIFPDDDDDDKLPDLGLEPKSEPKDPDLQTPDNPIVIDSDSSDCESPPAKKSHS